MSKETERMQDEIMHSMAEKYFEQRVTEDDKVILRTAFKDNLPLVKVLRKLFLERIDNDTPVHQNIDLFRKEDYAAMSPEEVKINILARNMLLSHLEQKLMNILYLVEEKQISPAELAMKRRQDSTK